MNRTINNNFMRCSWPLDGMKWNGTLNQLILLTNWREQVHCLKFSNSWAENIPPFPSHYATVNDTLNKEMQIVPMSVYIWCGFPVRDRPIPQSPNQFSSLNRILQQLLLGRCGLMPPLRNWFSAKDWNDQSSTSTNQLISILNKTYILLKQMNSYKSSKKWRKY